MKTGLRRLLPPVLVDLYRRWQSTYGFSGDFKSWEDARASCNGYDDPIIINHVRDAVSAVLKGYGAYERDGVVFKLPEYDWRFLSGLLLAASGSRGKLSVVDIGGSLGSTFLQYKTFLDQLPGVQWTVVEQSQYVQAGRGLFPKGPVRFSEDLSRTIRSTKPQVALLCSVLQYVPDPYALLDTVLRSSARYVIIDRTAVRSGSDRLTVQKNGPSHFNTSYPAWFLDEHRLRREILKTHDILYEFPALESTVHSGIPGAGDLGMVCKKRRSSKR